jgi:hypothetical protein
VIIKQLLRVTGIRYALSREKKSTDRSPFLVKLKSRVPGVVKEIHGSSEPDILTFERIVRSRITCAELDLPSCGSRSSTQASALATWDQKSAGIRCSFAYSRVFEYCSCASSAAMSRFRNSAQYFPYIMKVQISYDRYPTHTIVEDSRAISWVTRKCLELCALISINIRQIPANRYGRTLTIVELTQKLGFSGESSRIGVV